MEKRIYLSAGGEDRLIRTCDILYFAAASGRIFLHYEAKGKEDFLSFAGTIKDLERNLSGEGFIRIHRCYLINAERVVSVENGSVTLDGPRKITLPLGRTHVEAVKERLKETVIVL